MNRDGNFVIQEGYLDHGTLVYEEKILNEGIASDFIFKYQYKKLILVSPSLIILGG
jgi:hypothetical protein